MRLITAIIESYKVEDVRAALAAIGVHRMTATEVEGCGRQTGRSELDRGLGYVVDLLPRAKIEIAVAAGHAERVLQTVLAAACTGKIGDGKVIVTPRAHALCGRTGEAGRSAA